MKKTLLTLQKLSIVLLVCVALGVLYKGVSNVSSRSSVMQHEAYDCHIAAHIAEPSVEIPLADDESAACLLISEQPSDLAQLYEQEIAGKDLMLQDFYEQKLKEKEVELWQELYSTTGLQYDEVVQRKEEIKNFEYTKVQKKRKKHKKKSSNSTIELAREVMTDFSIDENSVDIIKGSSTCVGSCRLIVGERQLRTMPREGARSVLAHEMIHLQKDDDFMRDAMYDLLHRKGMKPEKFAADHPFYKHMRFEELRADILSSLKDISYAQGALESLSSLLRYGDNGYPTHPLTSDRIKAVQEVAELLVYEQQRSQQI